jgi:putative membrane protein
MTERLSISIGTAAVFLPTSVSAQGYGPQMMGWGGWGFGSIVGPFFMILVLAAVIAAVVLLVRWASGPQWTGSSYQEPSGRRSLDILKERFARGEIDKEEFEDRRRVLGE